MKTKLFISILLVSLALALFGQNVGPKKCKVCGKPFAQCQYRGKHPQKTENDVSSKPASHSSSKPSKPTNSKPSTSSQSPRTISVTYSDGVLTCNGIRYKMVYVEGGSFKMGDISEPGKLSNSSQGGYPCHDVSLSTYYIGETEVTQELWEAVMGKNPSYYKGAKRPVENVNWFDCQTFIEKLNAYTGKHFHLPTAAEWEYAARGRIYVHGYKYSGSNTPDDVAWYEDNSGNTTHNVATKRANELGLYDMSGNVDEWCMDYYDRYSESPQTNPKGSVNGEYRDIRGGNFGGYHGIHHLAYQKARTATLRSPYIGLRLALSK